MQVRKIQAAVQERQLITDLCRLTLPPVFPDLFVLRRKAQAMLITMPTLCIYIAACPLKTLNPRMYIIQCSLELWQNTPKMLCSYRRVLYVVWKHFSLPPSQINKFPFWLFWKHWPFLKSEPERTTIWLSCGQTPVSFLWFYYKCPLLSPGLEDSTELSHTFPNVLLILSFSLSFSFAVTYIDLP